DPGLPGGARSPGPIPALIYLPPAGAFPLVIWWRSHVHSLIFPLMILRKPKTGFIRSSWGAGRSLPQDNPRSTLGWPGPGKTWAIIDYPQVLLLLPPEPGGAGADRGGCGCRPSSSPS